MRLSLQDFDAKTASGVGHGCMQVGRYGALNERARLSENRRRARPSRAAKSSRERARQGVPLSGEMTLNAYLLSLSAAVV